MGPRWLGCGGGGELVLLAGGLPRLYFHRYLLEFIRVNRYDKLPDIILTDHHGRFRVEVRARPEVNIA